MKYRIKEIENMEGGSTFYIQHKIFFLLWVILDKDMGFGNYKDMSFETKQAAEEYIVSTVSSELATKKFYKNRKVTYHNVESES